MSLHAHMRMAREQLQSAGIAPEEAALDAELLARHVLGWDRATLLARALEEPPGEFTAAYEAVLERRSGREPVAYITGHQEFWGRDFIVGPGVLIPRPETELLIEEALDYARGRGRQEPLRIADVGTGSGCLAISLALELPEAMVHATDVSTDALAIARHNASRLGARVRFHHGSMLADIVPPLDLIVCNPPYVTQHDYQALPPEVREYEPSTALVGGDDGLEAVRLVIDAARATLGTGGRLLMEIGYGQADAVTRLVADAPALLLLRIRPDLQGIPRAVVVARGSGVSGTTASG